MAVKRAWNIVAMSRDDLLALSQVGMNAEAFRCLTERLVSCPKKRRRAEKDRGDQVCVGQTDSQAVQVTSLNH